MYRALRILFLLFALPLTVDAQDALIQIKNANSLSYDGEKNILKGNVICEHEGALLYCDTAFIYREQNRMTATGHILITKGDSIRVTGEKLVYDGKTRLATLENNVRCVEKDMVLTTQILTFDVKHSVANYYNGGTIVNKQNTLVSRNGHYYSGRKEAAFHYDVVLTNPQYKMNSDTLRYKVPSKTAYFLGPSIIISNTDYIYCENGWYDTDKEKARFSRNALLVTKHQKLRGDSLFYDRINKVGKAYRNITLTDTSQKSIIYGHYAEYHENRSEALVTGKPLYARIMEKDTLFIAADTLYHRDIDSVNNFLNAYHHVKLYKKDVQAMADSATLNTTDSLLRLYKSPLLWASRSQALAREIRIKLTKNEVKSFTLDGKAFLIQKADTHSVSRFNQLSGKTIVGTILTDTIRKVTVTGNAEMLYYPKNKEKLVGLNRTVCSEIHIWLPRGEIDRVSLTPKTTGNVDPLKEINKDSAFLKGFNWLYEKRPRSRFELHQR